MVSVGVVIFQIIKLFIIRVGMFLFKHFKMETEVKHTFKNQMFSKSLVKNIIFVKDNQNSIKTL